MNEYKISSINMDNDLINLIDEYIKATIKGYEKCKNKFVRDVFIGGNKYFAYLTFTQSKDSFYYVTKIEFRNYVNGNVIAIYTSREPNIYGHQDWYISYTIRTDDQVSDECDELLKLLKDQIFYLYEKVKNDTSNISMNDIIKTINAYREYKYNENNKAEIDNLYYHNSNIEFDKNGFRINIDNLLSIILSNERIDNEIIIKLNSHIEEFDSYNGCKPFYYVITKSIYEPLCICLDKDEYSIKNHIINVLFELYRYIDDLMN